MSGKYFDFVLCQMVRQETPFFEADTEPILYRAPAFSKLKKGDLVIVETETNDQMAKVVACCSLADDDKDTIDLVMNMTQAEDVKRVLAKLVYKEFGYKEVEDGSVDKDQ